MDGDRIYSDSALTNNVLGLAGIVNDTVNAGPHTLRVVVNRTTSADTTFSVLSDVYIGVSYLRSTGRIGFNVSTMPFVYL